MLDKKLATIILERGEKELGLYLWLRAYCALNSDNNQVTIPKKVLAYVEDELDLLDKYKECGLIEYDKKKNGNLYVEIKAIRLKGGCGCH